MRKTSQRAASPTTAPTVKPLSLVRDARAISSASKRLRRVWKPSRSISSICQVISAASILIRLSLLTEALIKMNCGLKAVNDAASSAKPRRPGRSVRAD